MAHVCSSLLVAVVFAAASMVASQETPPSPDQLYIPPFPAPADIPPTPPCLQDLQEPCALVYKDSSMLEPCCSAIKKLFKKDSTCICNAIDQARNMAKQYNYTIDGTETFRQCKMSDSSCEDEKIGNAGPNAKSIGAFRILLFLPLYFML